MALRIIINNMCHINVGNLNDVECSVSPLLEERFFFFSINKHLTWFIVNLTAAGQTHERCYFRIILLDTCFKSEKQS